MNKKFKEIRVLDYSYPSTSTSDNCQNEHYRFEFVYSGTISKIKAFLTSSAKSIKCNNSVTDSHDLVFTPTSLKQVIKAMENTDISNDNIKIYCEGAPITMDRKTNRIPFVFVKNIGYEEFVELLSTQFNQAEDFPSIKTKLNKLLTSNHKNNQNQEDSFIK